MLGFCICMCTNNVIIETFCSKSMLFKFIINCSCLRKYILRVDRLYFNFFTQIILYRYSNRIGNLGINSNKIASFLFYHTHARILPSSHPNNISCRKGSKIILLQHNFFFWTFCPTGSQKFLGLTLKTSLPGVGIAAAAAL